MDCMQLALGTDAIAQSELTINQTGMELQLFFKTCDVSAVAPVLFIVLLMDRGRQRTQHYNFYFLL